MHQFTIFIPEKQKTETKILTKILKEIQSIDSRLKVNKKLCSMQFLSLLSY